MNKLSQIFVFGGLAAAAALLSGCNTFQSRARERSETFDQLPTSEQQRLQRGAISIGDNQDMVYIALGSPDERRDVTTADGTQSVWVYRSYWQQYEGTTWLGYRRYVVPTARGYAIYHEPVTQDVYRTHADDRIRVTFDRNGVVSQVEQSSRR
jgi:outer membrane protein assembly factor BamE (lipoprotein component of BamABCDE complex)